MIPLDFFNEEVRCNFKVDKNRKKLWSIFIEIYFELKRVCDKYNLKVIVNGGTLLGTIRHNGFIPWDDDFDVAMSRKDFNFLCKISEKEFKDPYFFQYALSDRNYFVGIARLRRSDTTGIITFLSNHVYNNGIYLDIYVYDKIPEDNKKLRILVRKVKILSYFLNNYYHYNNTNKKISIFRPVFALTKYFVKYETLYMYYLKTCESYCDFATNRLGFLCMPYFLKYEETVDGFLNPIEHDFEFFKVLVPGDWDFALKKAYGEYMRFPPESERGKWHEDIIIYDVSKPFIEYYKCHKDRFSKVLKEYEEKGE